MCICRYMFCICCGYYMLIFFYRWFEFSMDNKISRVKILRGFLFPSLQFRDFFTIAKTQNWRLTKFSYRYDTLFTYVLFTVKIPLKKLVNVIFQVPSCFKRCEYKSKSGRFLWQSEEYSLKTVQLLLSVLVGSIDEDSTLLIFDPRPFRSVTVSAWLSGLTVVPVP